MRIYRVLNKLQIAWFKSPELRLGQFLINLTYLRMKGDYGLLFNLEDDTIEKLLDDYILTGKFPGTL